MIPCALLLNEALTSQLLDFSTISYRTTGVSVHTFYNYSYLKLHVMSTPSILHPLKPTQLFSSKSFNPSLLLPSYQLSRVIIWSMHLASAVKSHHFWPSASSETGLYLLVIMFRMIFPPVTKVKLL